MDDGSFAGDQSGDGERRADEQDQVDVKAMLGIEAELFGDPDVGLRRRNDGIGNTKFF